MLTYIVRHSFRILSYLLTYLCVASRGKNLRQFVAVFQWVMATSYGDRATSWSSVVQRRLSLVSRTPTLCAGSPRCTKCNRPPINSTSSVGYQLRIIRCSTIMPLESKGLINGWWSRSSDGWRRETGGSSMVMPMGIIGPTHGAQA